MDHKSNSLTQASNILIALASLERCAECHKWFLPNHIVGASLMCAECYGIEPTYEDNPSGIVDPQKLTDVDREYLESAS